MKWECYKFSWPSTKYSNDKRFSVFVKCGESNVDFTVNKNIYHWGSLDENLDVYYILMILSFLGDIHDTKVSKINEIIALFVKNYVSEKDNEGRIETLKYKDQDMVNPIMVI